MTLLGPDHVASDREDGQLLRRCAPRASSQAQLTVRAVVVGLFVGTILCFTNMYFGLQTGWVTMGSLQCAMVGFAILKYGGASNFNALENVVVQTVGVATATMPLAGGFVGIIPALQLLDPPVKLTIGEQLAWCAALCYFGIFFAVPLRRQTILVEKLPFPSGTATAKLIEVLHGGGGGASVAPADEDEPRGGELQARWRALGGSFALSFAVALLGFFAPPLANLKLFSWVCLPTLSAWHWSLRPSLSYVGQGIIMGPRSAFSMLAGVRRGGSNRALPPQLYERRLLGCSRIRAACRHRRSRRGRSSGRWRSRRGGWPPWHTRGPRAAGARRRASSRRPSTRGSTARRCDLRSISPISSTASTAAIGLLDPLDLPSLPRQGWTLWVAMGLMLAEAITSFGVLLALQLPQCADRGARTRATLASS